MLLCVYVPLGVLLVAVKLAAPHEHASVLIEPDFSPSESLTHGSLWVVGLVGWAAAVVACCIGTWRARGVVSLEGRRRLLAGAGLLTVLMLADDLFQLHKPVVPDATGIPSGVVLVLYAMAFGVWLAMNRRVLPDTDLGILLVTLAFFALWIFAKAAPGIPGRIPISSGAKLCGIAGWLTYLARTAAGAVREAAGDNRERAGSA